MSKSYEASTTADGKLVEDKPIDPAAAPAEESADDQGNGGDAPPPTGPGQGPGGN